MDLSNLSSNLPPTSPITEESIQELSNEITTNFKDAAKSVLALYRLSHSKNSLLVSKGYLDCLNDVLRMISNGEDVEDWALMKKNELTRMNRNDAINDFSTTTATANSNSSSEVMINHDEDEDEDYDEISEGNNDDDDTRQEDDLIKKFKLNNVSPAPFKFPPSMIPLSLNHSNVQHYIPRSKRVPKMNTDISEQQQQQQQQQQETSEEDEEILSDDYKRRMTGVNGGYAEKKSRFR